MQALKSNPSKDQELIPSAAVGKSQKVPFYVPLLNPLVKSLLHLGVPAGPMTLLTVRGRKTGKPYTTPVGLFKLNGHRYVFDTFGHADWVRNLREAREAKIGRGWNRRQVKAIQLRKEEAASVLREILAPYVASRLGSSFLKMGYSLTKASTMADYAREARRHAGFELLDKE